MDFLAGRQRKTARRLVIALVLSLVAAATWTSLFTTVRFEKRDAFDYAGLGREIREGYGFATRQLFPRDLPYLQERDLLNDSIWPSLHRYPATPAANAGFQLLIADPIKSAVVRCGFFFVLTVPIVFWFSARLLNDSAAVLCTLLFIGDPRMWRAAYDGMSESIATMLLMALVCTVLHPATRRGHRFGWILAGILVGLAYLTRTQLAILVPLLMIYIVVSVSPRRRLRALTLLLGVSLLTISPWLIRNVIVTGNPFFSITNTRVLLNKTEVGRFDLRLHSPVELSQVIDQHGGVIINKIITNIFPTGLTPSFWFGVLGIYAVVIPTILVFIFVRRRASRREIRLFELSVLILLACNFAVVATTNHRPRYYDPLIPLLIVVLVGQLWWVVERLTARSRIPRIWVNLIPVVLIGSLALLRASTTFGEHIRLAAGASGPDGSYSRLLEFTGSDSVIVSDLSLEITLFNRNPTIRPPFDPMEIIEIDEQYIPVDFLVLKANRWTSAYSSFPTLAAIHQKYALVLELPNGASVYKKRPTSEEFGPPTAPGTSIEPGQGMPFSPRKIRDERPYLMEGATASVVSSGDREVTNGAPWQQ